MDDVTDIRDFYDSIPEKEDSRLQSHQLERDITLRCFETYLPEHGRILEIGAATGHYTMELARRGYEVCAVDLSPNLVSKAKERAVREGLANQIELLVADARDLSAVPGEAYDAVLLMGPLYHLVQKEDRLLALSQVYGRLKSGGVLFSAFISRFGILGDLVKKQPQYIHEQKRFDALLARGNEDTPDWPGGFRGYFATVDEIAPLHEAAGFKTVTLAGVEPGISADDESYNRLEGETRRLWLELLYRMSTERSIIAASRHLLYVGRK